VGGLKSYCNSQTSIRLLQERTAKGGSVLVVAKIVISTAYHPLICLVGRMWTGRSRFLTIGRRLLISGAHDKVDQLGTGPTAHCPRFEQKSRRFSPYAYEIQLSEQLSEQLLWFLVYLASLQRTYLAEQSRHYSDVNYGTCTKCSGIRPIRN
jgi:hypothetical protein